MYTGLTGALKIIDSRGLLVTVAYISGWSIDNKTEIIETAKISNINKNAFPGMQSWTASAEGAVSFENGKSQEELFIAKFNGTPVILKFYLNDEKQTDNYNNDISTYFAGNGYIESLSVDLSSEDKGNISISIKGSGPLSLFINGKDVKESVDESLETLRFKIKDDGNLYLSVPDGSRAKAEIDDYGYLVLTL